MTTVSLLIPCYNAARYLPALWDSIQQQETPFDEVIFYDDASTDNTAEVAAGFPGTKVIRGQKNIGAGGARDCLAKAATGEFIHFQDADDPMDSRFLQKMKPLVGNEVDVAVCDADWINESDGSIVYRWRYKDAEIQPDPLAYTIGHCISLNNTLIRGELFHKTGGFNRELKIFEDADMHVRLAAHGGRFKVIEEVLTVSLRHDRGVSSDEKEIPVYRLKALQSYAKSFDAKYHPLLAYEAEKNARSFFHYGNREGMREALKLCIQLGLHPPETKNLALKMLKALLPTAPAFMLQQTFRQPFVKRGITLGKTGNG